MATMHKLVGLFVGLTCNKFVRHDMSSFCPRPTHLKSEERIKSRKSRLRKTAEESTDLVKKMESADNGRGRQGNPVNDKDTILKSLHLTDSRKSINRHNFMYIFMFKCLYGVPWRLFC